MTILEEVESKILSTEDLPDFVDLSTSNWFAVSRTGDVDRDFAIGEALANQALANSQRRQSGDIIALSLYSIIVSGRCEFLEAGYIRRLAAAAYAGYYDRVN